MSGTAQRDAGVVPEGPRHRPEQQPYSVGTHARTHAALKMAMLTLASHLFPGSSADGLDGADSAHLEGNFVLRLGDV